METEISKVGRFVKGEELEKPTSQKLVMAVDQISREGNGERWEEGKEMKSKTLAATSKIGL